MFIQYVYIYYFHKKCINIEVRVPAHYYIQMYNNYIIGCYYRMKTQCDTKGSIFRT